MNTGKLHLSRRKALIGMSGALLTAPALITSANADNHTDDTYTNRTLTISPFSLAISEMAIQKTTNPMVKEFAKLEKGEQEAVSLVIESTGATPPPRPAPLEDLYKRLEAATGEDFDRLYISSEISGHEDLYELQIPESGRRPIDVRVGAASILVHFIRTHLTMLAEIRKQLG